MQLPSFHSVLWIVLTLAGLCRAEVLPPPPDLPQPETVEYVSEKTPRFAPWIKVPENKYHYLVQAPAKIADDAPILIYMHCAGGDRREGMGLSSSFTVTQNGWARLRTELLTRGWIYVCPDIWEFDGLQEDLKKRYGDRTVYLMGGSWGGKDVFEEARFKLRQNPRAYGGVALLAAMINNGWPSFAGDKGPGSVTAPDFPVPVYLAVDGIETKIGGAMLKLYLRLRAAGATVRMDIHYKTGHPPITRVDWKVLLDHICGKVTGEHSLFQWGSPRKGQYVALQLDPALPGAPLPTLDLVPEPALRQTGDVAYWFTEPLFRYPKDTPMMIVSPDPDAGYQQAFAMADEHGKEWADKIKGANRIDDARHWTYNAEIPYVVSQSGSGEAQLAAITAEAGTRPLYVVGIGKGCATALELARAAGERVKGLLLYRPSAAQIKTLAEMPCAAAVTTASDAGEELGAAKEWLAKAQTAKRTALWLEKQGAASEPAAELIGMSDVFARLASGGAQHLRCGAKPGELEAANDEP